MNAVKFLSEVTKQVIAKRKSKEEVNHTIKLRILHDRFRFRKVRNFRKIQIKAILGHKRG